MTRQECGKLVMAMMALYSYNFPNPEESLRVMVGPWHMVLEEYTYEETMVGLKWFARADKKGFPPAPGQVVDCIIRAKEAAAPGGALDDGTAWALVMRALRDSSYHAEERFAELPPIVQRAVGSPGNLRDMAQEEKISVTKGQFLASYHQALERSRSEASMPPALRALAQKTSRELLGASDRRSRDVPALAWIEARDGRRELSHKEDGWNG